MASGADKIRAWMKQTLTTTGMSVIEWSAKSGVAKSTIFRAMKPDYEFMTSTRTLEKLAQVAGVPLPDVAPAREQQIVPAFLPVRYRVQAGLWYETDAYQEESHTSPRPVAPDPRYADWPQWLEEVVGDSVNLKIPEGGFAHVVDAVEMGYAPRDGDYVVVERRRAGGHIRERTIKQVAINGHGLELWPRSTNPKWSEPVRPTDGVGEDVEVEIVGLVIGAYLGF